MSATEELRRMLDERGVEWKEHKHAMPGSMAIQRETLWGQPTDVASGKPIPHVYHCRATEMGDGRLFLEAQLITPEQAIAATLGSSNCTNDCTNSERTETLTAEKVRELMEENSRQYPSPTDPYVWLTEYDWQTIADELNATLGRGTCHPVPIYGFDGEFTEYDYDECSKCGDEWDGDTPNFCPNCGAKVVDPTENDVDVEEGE